MTAFDDNLRALEERSPETAARIRHATTDAGFAVAAAADGSAIVERNGLPLESRRDPRQAAGRQAQGVQGTDLVVVGLGAGYLAEALLASGHHVRAIVENCPEAVAAAMRARDLRGVLRRVPVVLADVLREPVELICLKAKAPAMVPQAGAVGSDQILQGIVQAWPRVPEPTRPPRVLVVGPIAGGSVETARSTAAAVEEAGAQTRFIDFTTFGDGWDALSRLGLRPDRLERLQIRYADVLGDVVLEQTESFQPDLVLALAQAPLAARHLEALRRGGVRTAFWFVENHRVLPYWRLLAPAYDTFFAIQPEPFLEELRGAGSPRAVYLPTACDPKRHLPLDLTPDERRRFASEVSFAGAPYLNRRRMLPVVADLGLRIFGEGWAGTELAANVAEGGRRFDLDEMVRIFAASKVNLNLHSAMHVDAFDPSPDYVNPRTFELAACRAFQLVDHRDPLPELFAADEVVTFRSVAELREQTLHYLRYAEERRAFAERARARALRAHTFAHRVQRILRTTLPAAMVAAATLGIRRETLAEAIEAYASDPVMTRDEAVRRLLGEVRVP